MILYFNDEMTYKRYCFRKNRISTSGTQPTTQKQKDRPQNHN